MSFNVQKIRQDFPILHQEVYGKPFVYLDNAATSQKPKQVIDILNKYYLKYNSNIHRGIHFLSERSNEAYENARETIRQFINAGSSREIVFTSGTTESINLIAFSFGERYLQEGDEIIISEMEHHSNIVPWQMVCERKKSILKIIPFNEQGELILDEYEKLLNERTRLVSVTHISNSLGTLNPVETIIKKAHNRNIPVLIDGAQSVQHTQIDVRKLDCDFFVFSGHKVYGPLGTGVLYGKEKWLEELPPCQGGGGMIESVTFEKTVYNELPYKFEAGTSDYISAIGLAEAVNYINSIGQDKIASYEAELLKIATEKLLSIDGLKIYGTAKNKVSVISFLIKNIHSYDTGMLLDKTGIAVRTGNHCTQPVMDHFNIEGTVRASFAFYNTTEEIEVLYKSLIRIKEMFS